MHEAAMHDENSFLTLTYDDLHIPPNQSLVLSDFQDFMKRLRKSIEPRKVRYYHCGEYGEENKRPHYHALLFGYSSPDRKFFSGKGSNRVFTSDSMQRLWPHGFVVEGEVTFESAAYVARYVMKKITGEKAEAHYAGRTPEYVTMSRRPGIGSGWFEKYKTDVYPRDGVVNRGIISRPPRFYDDLLGKQDPALLASLKINREKNSQNFVTDVYNGKIIRESDSSMRRLACKAEVKEAQLKMLKRGL